MNAFATIPRASRTAIARLFWLVLAGAYAVLFLALCWPRLFFRYEIDPSDGDVLNNVERLARGLPLFGDWAKAEVFGNWSPLYYFYLLLGKPLGFDVTAFGRISNGLFVAFAFLAAAFIVVRALPEARQRLVFGVLCLVLLDRQSGHYAWAVNLRADPLLFLVEMGACCVLAFQRQRIWLLALLSVLAFLAKQPGLEVGVACATYFLLCERQYFLRYLGAAVAVAALCIAPLEWHNSGNFLRDTLFLPLAVFSRTANWPHLMWLFSSYYANRTVGLAGLAALVGIGCSIYYRLKIVPLVALLLIDLVMLLKTGQNDGGGISYLWLHWALVCVFAAVGCFYLVASEHSVLARLLEKRPRHSFLRYLAPMAVVLLICRQSRPAERVANYRREVAQYESLALVGEAHQRIIDEVTAQAPRRKWYAERFAAAVVRAGNVLEQEACTLKSAYDAGIVRRPQFIGRLKSGEYHFVQRSGYAAMPLVEDVLDSYFHVIRSSQAVDRGRVIGVQVWEYTGPPKQ